MWAVFLSPASRGQPSPCLFYVFPEKIYGYVIFPSVPGAQLCMPPTQPRPVDGIPTQEQCERREQPPLPTAFVRGASRRFPVSRRAPLTPISGYHPSPILSVLVSSCYDTSQGLLLPLPLPPRQRKNSPKLGLGLGVVKAPELHAVHLGVGVRLSGDMAAHDVVLVVLRTRKTRGGGGDAGIERVSIFSGKKRLQRV